MWVYVSTASEHLDRSISNGWSAVEEKISKEPFAGGTERAQPKYPSTRGAGSALFPRPTRPLAVTAGAAGARRRPAAPSPKSPVPYLRSHGARSMRAAVSAPPPHCYSSHRATLLDARHVFDNVPQRRLPPLAARAQPAAAAARRPARRSAVSAFAPACRAAASGTRTGAFISCLPALFQISLLAYCSLHVLTFGAA